MAGHIYRTANGKQIDMRALALKNENVRAVGNMKVNARGDVISDANRVIKSKNSQVDKQYRQQVQVRKGNEG
jgi:hypothetical protein